MDARQTPPAQGLDCVIPGVKETMEPGFGVGSDDAEGLRSGDSKWSRSLQWGSVEVSGTCPS